MTPLTVAILQSAGESYYWSLGTPLYSGYSTVSWVLRCILQCGELHPYPEELDNNWFYPASAPALSFHQVCTRLCLISCELIDAATVLSTLAHAPESSPDWSWEHYCQEEDVWIVWLQLMHSHGSLMVECSEVNVSYTSPGDDCVITVQLTTPQHPGNMFF